jgi:hypothetical protein
MGESEFVVAMSLDRDWYSPDQAKRLVDVAAGEGLLSRADGTLQIEFDPDTVSVPEQFAPDESLLRQRSAFERLVDEIVGTGMEKQEVVATVNRLQAELGLTIEAAAVVFAHRRGLDVTETATDALEDL